MDAVGDVADWNLFFNSPGPEVSPHSAGDMAVERADRIGSPRELESQDGHTKRFVVVLRLDAAQTQELFAGDTEFVSERPEMFLDQRRAKTVVAGRDGCVSRKNGLPCGFAERVVKAHAVVVHSLADDFKRSKRAVAFIEVIDAGSDAQRSQNSNSTYAEHEFLANSSPFIASIESSRQFSILGIIAFDVAVEQI